MERKQLNDAESNEILLSFWPTALGSFQNHSHETIRAREMLRAGTLPCCPGKGSEYPWHVVQLPCGSRRGLGHSRVSGLLEEKQINISRLKSDQIKNRLELLRSEEDGISVSVNLTEGPCASDCSCGGRGALKNGQTASNTWWLRGKMLCWSDTTFLEKVCKEMEGGIGKKWCHSTGSAHPPVPRHKKSSRQQKPTASLRVMSQESGCSAGCFAVTSHLQGT